MDDIYHSLMNYDPDKLDELEFAIAEILEKDGEQFYEIKTYEKINNEEKLKEYALKAKPAV